MAEKAVRLDKNSEKPDKESLVRKEQDRVSKIFSEIPKDKKALVDGLITETARLRVSLDELWKDICDNGDVEKFCQSEKAPAYDRERPVARLYNARIKLYQTNIKQLCDLLPESVDRLPGSELMDYVLNGVGK